MSASPTTAASRDIAIERCDLCIVGAGIAGLNALFVASRYLSRDQRVILVDRRHRVGGMWVDTYPYVRLHQPHGLFTAGNIKWTLGRERSYLATKPEVLDHFDHCLDVIKQRCRSTSSSAGCWRHPPPRTRASRQVLDIRCGPLIHAAGLQSTPGKERTHA